MLLFKEYMVYVDKIEELYEKNKSLKVAKYFVKIMLSVGSGPFDLDDQKIYLKIVDAA
jgi:hypothetical protein